MIRSIASISLCIASAYAAIDIITPNIGELSPSFDGTVFDNCIQITPTYNFHWSVVGNDLCVAHEGFSADDVYFGFAVVADPAAPNRMAGADTVLSMFDNNQPTAIDFFMNAVQECDVASGMGVCPDELILPAGINDVVGVTGFSQEGLQAVGYSRPLNGNGLTDLDVDIANNATYIFAIGPRRGDGLPMYHMATRGAAVVNLGRTPSFDCVQLDPAQLVTDAPTPAPTNAPASTNAPNPTDVDDAGGASTAKPEYLLAALVLIAALL